LEAEAEPHVAGFEHDEIEYASGGEAVVDVIKDMVVGGNKLIMKNGCCRECMKAFSKTGKSCLCQVPRMQRRATLPINGCKFCGCKGCNPIDIRRDKRQELKNNLQKEGKLVMKRQRLLDSDDEDLEMNTRFDEWNKARKEFGQMI